MRIPGRNVNLVADALLGIADHYPKASVFWVKFTDFLQILSDEPTVVTISVDGKRVLCSKRHSDSNSTGIATSSTPTHHIDLRSWPDRTSRNTLVKRLTTAMEKGTKNPFPQKALAASPVSPSQTDTSAAPDLLTPFTTRYQSLISESGLPLSIPEDSRRTLFAVVRFVNGDGGLFPVSDGTLTLSDPEKDAATEALSTGTVQIASTGSSSKNANELRSTLLVPIHVGGYPWLCLGLRYLASQNTFQHNYWFYRDAIPTLSDRIREHARDAFFDVLVAAFRASLSPNRLNRINAAWSDASMVYPFSRYILKEHGNDHRYHTSNHFCITFGTHSVRVEEQQNAHLTHETLTLPQTLLQNRLEAEISAVEHGVFSARTDLARAWAHEVKNRLRQPIAYLKSLSFHPDKKTSVEPRIAHTTLLNLSAFSIALKHILQPSTSRTEIAEIDCALVDNVLQYLVCCLALKLDAASENGGARTKVTLQWQGRAANLIAQLSTSEHQIIARLGENYGETSQYSLIYGLLQEVVRNIRNDNAPPCMAVIHLHWHITSSTNCVTANIVQTQYEMNPEESVELPPPGIQSANDLFRKVGKVNVEHDVTKVQDAHYSKVTWKATAQWFLSGATG